jgi:type I restriction-modification system DNA methylase subunit
MEFKESSKELTKSLSKEMKKDNGIFFTPRTARETVFELLKKHKIKPKNILEPSFGSGEFLDDLHLKFPKAKITGVEKCTELFNSVKYPNLQNIDFMLYETEEKHDLIIGNPPFVVIPKSTETLKCQSLRPNLFVQFIYKSLSLTKGYIAFILPTSFFNCSYYEKMRKILFEETTILEVFPLEGKYLETQQDTFLLLLKKGKLNSDYFFIKNSNHYLSPYYKELEELLKDSTTLTELEFQVKTGDVVWNQEKEKLKDTGILLIYSSNFKNGILEFPLMKKPKYQYIQDFKKESLKGKTILINRGYGNTKYSLNAVIADYPEYYAENHVNVIRPLNSKAEKLIPQILKSLKDEKTKLFIKYFVGNGALSKSEIEGCLPIYII